MGTSARPESARVTVPPPRRLPEHDVGPPMLPGPFDLSALVASAAADDGTRRLVALLRGPFNQVVNDARAEQGAFMAAATAGGATVDGERGPRAASPRRDASPPVLAAGAGHARLEEEGRPTRLAPTAAPRAPAAPTAPLGPTPRMMPIAMPRVSPGGPAAGASLAGSFVRGLGGAMWSMFDRVVPGRDLTDDAFARLDQWEARPHDLTLANAPFQVMWRKFGEAMKLRQNYTALKEVSSSSLDDAKALMVFLSCASPAEIDVAVTVAARDALAEKLHAPDLAGMIEGVGTATRTGRSLADAQRMRQLGHRYKEKLEDALAEDLTSIAGSLALSRGLAVGTKMSLWLPLTAVLYGGRAVLAASGLSCLMGAVVKFDRLHRDERSATFMRGLMPYARRFTEELLRSDGRCEKLVTGLEQKAAEVQRRAAAPRPGAAPAARPAPAAPAPAKPAGPSTIAHDGPLWHSPF